MTNSELAQKLRDLAQIYEDNPTVRQPYIVESRNLVFCHNPEEWHATVRAFGAGRKSADDNALLFTPDAFPFLQSAERAAAVPAQEIAAALISQHMVAK